MDVKIKNNKIPEVKSALQIKAQKALENIGLLAESYAKLLTPVDTGNLRDRLTHQVVGSDVVYIGTNVEYGKYVELGTSRMSKRPFLEPAIKGHMNEYRLIVQNELKD